MEEEDEEQEKIIRREARNFFTYNMEKSNGPSSMDNISKLRVRISDFYFEEYKAFFLDELKMSIEDKLKRHRDKAHGGRAEPGCSTEIEAERTLFYVNQELDVLPRIVHQKFENSGVEIRNSVFISYSHSDKDFLKELQRHFKPIHREIQLWDDSKIDPGQKWKEEIKKALSKTKVAILLISTDFLGSDFIHENELPPLLEAAELEGSVILSVILKPCLFDQFPNLSQFQAMNPPNFPISKMSDDEKEELLVNVVRQTMKHMGSNKG